MSATVKNIESILNFRYEYFDSFVYQYIVENFDDIFKEFINFSRYHYSGNDFLRELKFDRRECAIKICCYKNFYKTILHNLTYDEFNEIKSKLTKPKVIAPVMPIEPIKASEEIQFDSDAFTIIILTIFNTVVFGTIIGLIGSLFYNLFYDSILITFISILLAFFAALGCCRISCRIKYLIKNNREYKSAMKDYEAEMQKYLEEQHRNKKICTDYNKRLNESEYKKLMSDAKKIYELFCSKEISESINNGINGSWGFRRPISQEEIDKISEYFKKNDCSIQEAIEIIEDKERKKREKEEAEINAKYWARRRADPEFDALERQREREREAEMEEKRRMEQDREMQEKMLRETEKMLWETERHNREMEKIAKEQKKSSVDLCIDCKHYWTCSHKHRYTRQCLSQSFNNY